MARTTVFSDIRSGSQAVRIPKALEFPQGVRKASIVREVHALAIAPEEGTRDSWFDGEGVANDFLNDRD